MSDYDEDVVLVPAGVRAATRPHVTYQPVAPSPPVILSPPPAPPSSLLPSDNPAAPDSSARSVATHAIQPTATSAGQSQPSDPPRSLALHGPGDSRLDTVKTLLFELQILVRAGKAASADASDLFVRLMSAWDWYAKRVNGDDLRGDIDKIKFAMPWMQISGGPYDALATASKQQAGRIQEWSPKPASGSLTPYPADPGGITTQVGGGRPDVDY